MKKSGFTLMELMVYIAIMGIVVLVAGQAFSDSTKMRVRTQSMLTASQVASNVGTLLKDDIAQMGAKSGINNDVSPSSSTSGYFFYSEAYIDPNNASDALKDSSSFSLTTNTESGHRQDNLIIRRISYGDNGAYQRVEEVNWYVQNGSLFRSCQTLDGDEDSELCPEEDPATTEIASGIIEFAVTPAKPDVNDGENLLFPYYETNLTKKDFRLIPYNNTSYLYYGLNVDPPLGGERITLSSFTTNYSENSDDMPNTMANAVKHMLLVGEDAENVSGAWNDLCKAITFEKDQTYEISFNMGNGNNASKMFQPNVDHMSVGLRKKGESPIPESVGNDFFFYPPEAADGRNFRKVRFSLNSTETACVSFSFIFSSPSASAGLINIDDLRIKKIAEHYTFEETYTPTPTEKKNIRAIRLILKTKKNGEYGGTELVIPVPSNGVGG